MSIQEQVRLGYNIIDEMGLFTNACRDWRILPPAQPTFDKFKLHFKRWDRDRRYTDTMASAGYHGATNQAVQRPNTPISSVASPTDVMDAKIDAIQAQVSALLTALSASKNPPTTFPSTVSLAGVRSPRRTQCILMQQPAIPIAGRMRSAPMSNTTARHVNARRKVISVQLRSPIRWVDRPEFGLRRIAVFLARKEGPPKWLLELRPVDSRQLK
eukprot:scaffold139275_cov59-Attheya_sp.AAC.2